ncbi:MAG: TSUP family transporter, partial [Clostridia bacterium]|nr:TSUP family transporter [Clostridia bacterium]
MQTYLIVLPLVFLAGFIDSIAGGGGLISLPAYLIAGLPAHLASGTNKMSAVFGTALATAKYGKDKTIVYKAAIPAVAGALPGAWLGAQLQMLVPERTVYIFMMAAIPV